MNFIFLLDTASDVCEKLSPVWTIFGYIIFAIKIVVPLLLVITGMITMAQAVMKQKEDEIKKAQQLLVHKLIAAVLVFLVVQIVSIVVNLVSGPEWKSCAKCATNPFKSGCYIVQPEDNPGYDIS